MKLFFSLVSLSALLNPLVVCASEEVDANKNPSLRLMSRKRQPYNGNNRDLVGVEEFLWGEADGKKRRRKKAEDRDDGRDSSIQGSKSSKSEGKGDSSSGSKGSKGSKGDSSSSSLEEDTGRDDCYGDECGGDGGDGGSGDRCGANACCYVDVYEFVGQTGSLIADKIGEDPIENLQFAQYVIDDNIYVPDGELSGSNKLSNPAVYNTGKCTQVRLGKQCEGQGNTPIDDRECCEGLTHCDIQYNLSDDFGPIGDILVSGGLTDNSVNVIPITGGTGAFQKAYGEVVITAEYSNPAINSCPNISEVNLYDVAAKIYVEVCEYELRFAAAEQVVLPVTKKDRNQKNYGW